MSLKAKASKIFSLSATGKDTRPQILVTGLRGSGKTTFLKSLRLKDEAIEASRPEILSSLISLAKYVAHNTPMTDEAKEAILNADPESIGPISPSLAAAVTALNSENDVLTENDHFLLKHSSRILADNYQPTREDVIRAGRCTSQASPVTELSVPVPKHDDIDVILHERDIGDGVFDNRELSKFEAIIYACPLDQPSDITLKGLEELLKEPAFTRKTYVPVMLVQTKVDMLVMNLQATMTAGLTDAVKAVSKEVYTSFARLAPSNRKSNFVLITYDSNWQDNLLKKLGEIIVYNQTCKAL